MALDEDGTDLSGSASALFWSRARCWRVLFAGLAVLLLSLVWMGAAASACEGGGGPPSSPEKEELENECNPALTIKTDCSGDPVNDASGELSEEQTDVSVGGRGPGLHVSRTYGSLAGVDAKEPGLWGYGWTGPYGASLEVSGTTATVHQESGNAAVFYEVSGKYTQGGWDQASLEKSGSNYIYTLPDQSKLEFNSEKRLVKETERDGNSNTFTYNGSHQLEKVKDGDERLLTFKYNGSGLVESVTDPMSHVIKYAYLSGNLLSVTIEGKTRWEFEYESHLLKKIVDGRGDATTIEYETGAPHRVLKQTIGGHERKFKYGAGETKIIEPNGSETLETFNSANEPTKTVRARGTNIETVTEDEYSGSNFEVTKLIDPNKHDTTYEYDSEGNKTLEKDPNGDERKWKYDKAHDVLEETTPEGETTTIKRNSHGEPETVERSINSETQKTEYKYGTDGELAEEVDPLGHTTKFTYDAAGDKEMELLPEGQERKWKYNSDSQVTEETSARGFTTTIERDERGLPTMITDPLGHLTEYTYDGNGNVETETDGNKHTTKYTYNEENLRTKVEESNKTLVETGYDSEGQMTSHTDGNKHVWEYKRNLLEQVIEEKNPLGKVWKKTYEKAGDLELLEDPEKHLAKYGYDESDRLKSIKYSTGKPSEVTFGYSKDSRVTLMKDETGLTENAWDKLDRLTKYKNGAGKTVEYEYDLANLPSKIVYPNGEHITRAYNKDNLLEKVTDFKGNVTSFDYNADGQLEKTLFPTGTEETDEYTYNKADQLTLIEMLRKSSVLASLEYERDGDGQVTNTTSTGLPGAANSKSVYNENNRLIEANKQAYEYDKANNPLQIKGLAGYAYNEADELTESHEAKYTYNEDGQRTKTEPTSGQPATNYTYDQNGNLIGIKRAKGTEESEIEDSYTYDGNNLRQLQDIGGTVSNLTWDTAETISLILSDETNSYIYGPENLPIEQIPKTGEPQYLHHDQQGSTRLITSSTGEQEAAYTYTPYGALEASAGTATTPLRYDAQYASSDTGLIYLRARTYDPATAQFLSVDPAIQETGEPYAYSGDNPIDVEDPDGARGRGVNARNGAPGRGGHRVTVGRFGNEGCAIGRSDLFSNATCSFPGGYYVKIGYPGGSEYTKFQFGSFGCLESKSAIVSTIMCTVGAGAGGLYFKIKYPNGKEITEFKGPIVPGKGGAGSINGPIGITIGGGSEEGFGEEGFGGEGGEAENEGCG
jgi:RHS repeat-associated protein